MTPFDGCAEGFLPRIGAPSRLEQVEPLPQAVDDLLWREHADAGGGELERERQIVSRAHNSPTASLVAKPGSAARASQEELPPLVRLQGRNRIGLLLSEA